RVRILLAKCRVVADKDVPALLEEIAALRPEVLVEVLSEPWRLEGEPEGEGRDLLALCPRHVLAALLEHPNASIRQNAILLMTDSEAAACRTPEPEARTIPTIRA